MTGVVVSTLIASRAFQALYSVIEQFSLSAGRQSLLSQFASENQGSLAHSRNIVIVGAGRRTITFKSSRIPTRRRINSEQNTGHSIEEYDDKPKATAAHSVGCRRCSDDHKCPVLVHFGRVHSLRRNYQQ